MRRRILIVFDTGLSGNWLGSTRRLLDTALGLRGFGWDVTLLAAEPGRGSEVRAQEAAFAGRVVRTPFFGAYPRIARSRYGRWLWRKWWAVSGKARYYSDPEWGWGKRASQWVEEGWTGESFEVVFAIGSGALDSFVAGRNLAVHFGAPLVLEFRDPIPNPAHPPLNHTQESALRSCLATAGAVVTTTEALAVHVRSAFPECRAPVVAIHSWLAGACVEAGRVRYGSETLLILHAGTLTGGSARNARSVVEGLALALSEDPSVRVGLRLVGGGKGGREAGDLARSLGIGSAVEVLPVVPPDVARCHMEEADVLLVIKYADPRFDMQIPGKLFEYLGMGKPILGIMGENEAAEILRRSGLGIIVRHDDAASIAGAIRTLWQQRRVLQEMYHPNWEYVLAFSRDRMMNRLDGVLRAVTVKDAPQTRRGG